MTTTKGTPTRCTATATFRAAIHTPTAAGAELDSTRVWKGETLKVRSDLRASDPTRTVLETEAGQLIELGLEAVLYYTDA